MNNTDKYKQILQTALDKVTGSKFTDTKSDAYWNMDVQDEITDQMVRMGGGNLIGKQSQYE